jgi:hypothetical protein
MTRVLIVNHDRQEAEQLVHRLRICDATLRSATADTADKAPPRLPSGTPGARVLSGTRRPAGVDESVRRLWGQARGGRAIGVRVALDQRRLQRGAQLRRQQRFGCQQQCRDARGAWVQGDRQSREWTNLRRGFQQSATSLASRLQKSVAAAKAVDVI